MKSVSSKLTLPLGLGLLAGFAILCASVVRTEGQWPYAPDTPMSQRNALNLVVNQVSFFQNATRTASAYNGGGYGMLLQQFQAVRAQYGALKNTMNAQLLNSGANQFAELDSGLGIIQQAFGDYQTAVANGQSSAAALARMSRALNEAMGVWIRELKQVCRQTQVGW